MRHEMPAPDPDDGPLRDLAAEVYLSFSSDPKPTVGGFLKWFASEEGLPPAPRILDVGVGPGRLFPLFKEMGWNVTGLEPDPEYYPAAKSAAVRSGMPVPRLGGWSQIDDESSFDLVTAINDPVSHLLSQEERTQAFARVLRALRPRGIFLFDVPNFDWILQNYRSPAQRRAAISGGEARLARRHEIDRQASLFTTIEDIEISRAGSNHRLTKRITYAMTSVADLEGALREVGFADIRTYNGYQARKAESISGSRVLIATRRMR